MATLDERVINLQTSFNSQAAHIAQDMEQMKGKIENFLTVNGQDLEVRLQNMQHTADTHVQLNANQHAAYEQRLNELSDAMRHVQAYIASNSGGQSSFGTKQEQIMPTKLMVPDKFEGELKDWRRWRADVRGYLDAVDKGAAEDLLKCEVSPVEVTEANFTALGAKGLWTKGHQLWMLVKSKTSGEALRTILGGPEGNGWEAWRRLNIHYEPSIEVRKGQTAAEFSLLCARPARDGTELRKILLEFDAKKKSFQEICGEEPSEWHLTSVLTAVLDPETRRHTAGSQTAGYASYRQKIQEFLNVTALETVGDRMDISRVGHGGDNSNQAEQQAPDQETLFDDVQFTPEQIWALGQSGMKVCFNCDKPGHLARECRQPKKQTKGAQKGGGKGNAANNPKGNGKGGGYGPAVPAKGGCFTCGGPHFKKDCPKRGGGGKVYGVEEENKDVEQLCNLRIAQPNPQMTCVPCGHAVDYTENEENFITVESKKDKKKKRAKECEHAEVPVAASRTARPTPVAATGKLVPAATSQKPGNSGYQTKKNMTQKIGMLGIVEPGKVNAVTDGDWEELEMAIDSGASESVMNEDMLPSVPVRDGEAKRRGVQYEVADGTLIPNKGEKTFVGVAENGLVRGMKMQVCDVNKALLSVRRMTETGNKVVLEAGGGYIESKTGERVKLHMKDGLYMMKMWVKKTEKSPASGFQRPE